MGVPNDSWILSHINNDYEVTFNMSTSVLEMTLTFHFVLTFLCHPV